MTRKKIRSSSLTRKNRQKRRAKYTKRHQLVSWSEKSDSVLLIDGENISFRYMAFIQSKVLQFGTLKHRRVYGNWSTGHLKGWETILTLYSLEVRHYGPVASGKNATDIALVVDALLLHSTGTGTRKYFLAAADSDYTPLVEALCSRGCFVMVLGSSTTPLALRKASTVFVELPSLDPQTLTPQRAYSKSKEEAISRQRLPSPQRTPQKARITQNQLCTWIREGLISFNASPYAWVQVPRFEKYLTRLDPAFNPKTYGYKNMLALLRAFPGVFRLRPYRGNAQVYEVQRVRKRIPL